MTISWSSDGSICPICREAGHNSERYPAALCESCQSSLLDGNGNSLELYNEGFSGGLMIVSPNFTRTSPEAEKIPLYTKNGIECRAEEHRFGGVVVQPLRGMEVKHRVSAFHDGLPTCRSHNMLSTIVAEVNAAKALTRTARPSQTRPQPDHSGSMAYPPRQGRVSAS